MTRALFMVLASCLLALLFGCGGGGGNDDNVDGDNGPLDIVLCSASPDHGFASTASPLRVTLTWNIAGGTAPYYYALDWNNDGQFDYYVNKVYNKTMSVVHDYYPIGTTPYQVVLRVTDSDATTVSYPSTTDTPVTITVSSTQTVQFDPLATYADNNNNPDDDIPGDDYQYPSGTPVFFRTAVLNGAEPYQYQWDFDADGMIDSTVANPQFTFTYDGVGLKTEVVRVQVVDGNSEKVTRDFVLSILGSEVPPQPVPAFEIILSTDPIESGVDTSTGYKLVDVPFLPGSTDPNIPTEPKVDLAVVVNPDPEKAGVPPYEYYWDYENDGAYDSQMQSPTLPYYDTVRKILVNPYALDDSENQKTFILRCMVIDGAGRRQDEFRAINVHRITVEPGEFTGAPAYGVVSGPYAGLHYAEITDDDPDLTGMQYPETQVTFNVANISGGQGATRYQWMIDVDNDGFAEEDWTNISGNSFSHTVSFGPIGGGASDWPAVGYFPVRVSIRALNNATPPGVVDEITYDMPVSLVMRPETDSISGIWKARKGHNVCVTFDNQSRTMSIMGGSQGTTPLRDVESLTQNVDTDPNTPDPITATAGTPLLFERQEALLFGTQDEGVAWLLGGANLINGTINSIEGCAMWEIPLIKPWWLGGLIIVGNGTVTDIPGVPTAPDWLDPPLDPGTYIYTPDGGNSFYLSDPAAPLIEDNGVDFSTLPISSSMTIHNTNKSSPNYGKSASLLGVPIENLAPPPPDGPGYQLITTQMAITADIFEAGDTYEIHYNGGLINEMAGALGYMPLEQAMGQPAYINEPMALLSGANAGYVIVGGLYPGGDVDEVSGRLISFDPGRMDPFKFMAMDIGNRMMLTPRYDGAAVYIENEHKLYVLGGRVATGQSVATVEVFNFATTQWEIGPSMLDARSGHTAILIDDGFRPLIYVLGGAEYPAGGARRSVVDTAEVFNPETGAWSYTLPPALPTENAGAVAVPSKETIGFGSVSAIWYFGGADSYGAESKELQELVYAIP